MLLQLSDGLLELGPGERSVNKCLRYHGLTRQICDRKITWPSGTWAIRPWLRYPEDASGKFTGTKRHQRSSLLVSRSQRVVDGGEVQPRRSVHFIGIGGVGLSALAFLALEQGWHVSGSDATSNNRMEALKAAGATVYVGHARSQVLNTKGLGLPDAIVVSSAIPRNNEEIEAAQEAGLPIYKRAEWLGKITEGYELLAVAGSHGKSTTAAMLATVLYEQGEDITAIVGAEVPQVEGRLIRDIEMLFPSDQVVNIYDAEVIDVRPVESFYQFPGGRNAIFGQGQRFVLEADEYDGCFLGVKPALAVVTNVEWEHVDMFPDEASVRDMFKKFVLQIRPGGTLVVCGDSAGSKLLANVLQKEDLLQSIAGQKTLAWPGQRKSNRAVTFGFGNGNDWQAVMLSPNVRGGTDYVAVHAGRPMARVSLQIPGTHNVLNSLAALVVVSLLGSQGKISTDMEDELKAMKGAAEAAGKILAQFVGICRRFEFVGEVKGCVIYDDYAHHPTEVRAVLQAARQRFDQHSIWVVFQPHTYSRLANLLHDFAPAFSAADRVIVTEVYAAREENVWNVSGADLTSLITGPPAIFIPSLENVVERLSWELTVYQTMQTETQGRIVLLTLGAGDITNVGPQLLTAFQSTSM